MSTDKCFDPAGQDPNHDTDHDDGVSQLYGLDHYDSDDDNDNEGTCCHA